MKKWFTEIELEENKKYEGEETIGKVGSMVGRMTDFNSSISPESSAGTTTCCG